MIEKLYGKYFQKSRTFLYPALGIKKNGKFVPSGTYISLSDLITADEMKLIVSFKHSDSEEFKTFENEELLSNPLFSQCILFKDYNLYVFNLENYKQDWSSFLLGKYSKLSPTLKRAIKTYYGEHSAEYQHVETYLYPEKYYDLYAKLLNVEVTILQKARELCDPVNVEKENIKIPVEDLENLKKVV